MGRLHVCTQFKHKRAQIPIPKLLADTWLQALGARMPMSGKVLRAGRDVPQPLLSLSAASN